MVPSSPVEPGSDPELIRDTHLFLLESFGTSIGFDFYPQPLLEPSSRKRITVFGRFDRRAPQREFGLQLSLEEIEDGRLGRVAWVTDLYLPERRRRQGAGTRLMDSLLELWEGVGVSAARATTTDEGFAAFTSWGFERVRSDLEDSLWPVRLQLPRTGSTATDSPASP